MLCVLKHPLAIKALVIEIHLAQGSYLSANHGAGVVPFLVIYQVKIMANEKRNEKRAAQEKEKREMTPRYCRKGENHRRKDQGQDTFYA